MIGGPRGGYTTLFVHCGRDWTRGRGVLGLHRTCEASIGLSWNISGRPPGHGHRRPVEAFVTPTKPDAAVDPHQAFGFSGEMGRKAGGCLIESQKS